MWEKLYGFACNAAITSLTRARAGVIAETKTGARFVSQVLDEAAGILSAEGYPPHVLLVRGNDGLDEITTTTTTSAWIAQDGAVRQDTIDPSRLGISPALPADLVGGDASYNAQVVRELLAGRPGPVRDAVLLNAAGAVAVFNGLSDDVHADLLAAKDVVARAIDSGAGAALLDRWITLSSKLAASGE